MASASISSAAAMASINAARSALERWARTCAAARQWVARVRMVFM